MLVEINKRAPLAIVASSQQPPVLGCHFWAVKMLVVRLFLRCGEVCDQQKVFW